MTKFYRRSVATWPRFLLCYNVRSWWQWSTAVAAWPHFLICYNLKYIFHNLWWRCGLTAFSNLLQPKLKTQRKRRCCGLTAFSKLLQQFAAWPTNFFCCGLTAFSNLLQHIWNNIRRLTCCGLTAFSNLLQLYRRYVLPRFWLRLDRIF